MKISSMVPREELLLRKVTGDVITNIKAIITPNKIIVEDASVNIEEDDIFERTLPNTSIEKFKVIDRGFINAIGSFDSHYQVQVERVRNGNTFMRDTNSTINNFYGDTKNVQIQQGTQNSIQSMKAENEFDYNGAAEIFKQILCNIDSFNLLDDDKNKLKEIAIEAQQFSESKTNDSAISKTLSLVKDIMLRATGSLTASGILHLLSQSGV